MNQSSEDKAEKSQTKAKSLWKLFAWAQGAAFAGTVVDFVCTIFFTEVLYIWYVISTALGSLAGAITNFLMGRYWVFQSTEQKIQQQAFRYALVSAGSLILNTGGVYLLTEFIRKYIHNEVPYEQDYIIAKIIVAIIVAFSYNFILQKNYVYEWKADEGNAVE